MIALNRLIVYAEVNGPGAALQQMEHFDNKPLRTYYIYPAALGEWQHKPENSPKPGNILKRQFNSLNPQLKKVAPKQNQ